MSLLIKFKIAAEIYKPKHILFRGIKEIKLSKEEQNELGEVIEVTSTKYKDLKRNRMSTC